MRPGRVVVLVGGNEMRQSVWRLVLQIAGFRVFVVAVEGVREYVTQAINLPLLVLCLDLDAELLASLREFAPPEYTAVAICSTEAERTALAPYAMVAIEGHHLTARVLEYLRLATVRKRGPKTKPVQPRAVEERAA